MNFEKRFADRYNKLIGNLPQFTVTKPMFLLNEVKLMAFMNVKIMGMSK